MDVILSEASVCNKKLFISVKNCQENNKIIKKKEKESVAALVFF